MTEMYLGDKDLVLEARRYQSALLDIQNQVQQLVLLNTTLNKSMKSAINSNYYSVSNLKPSGLQLDSPPRKAPYLFG
jgi:hypothetical protein